MNAMTWVLAIAGIILGFTLGWARSRSLLANAVSRADYDKLMQEKTTFAAKLEAASEQLEQALSKKTEFQERALTAEANSKALQERLKEQQEQLRAEFKNTANGIFEEISKKFSTHSEKKIGEILQPVQERLNDFKKLVEESFSTQGKEQHTLKSEIAKIVLQADSLTKALRGDSKAQGNWGEVMLERILEESGLRRDEDYILQGADMKLTDAEGGRQQPDVIINLPDDKHIIVDAKVSLTSYERYCSEADELAQAVHLREFLKSVKTHVNGLAEKRYQHNEKLQSPDFVLMFMPVEGAYSLAIQQDRELHTYAWGRKIAIVCPSTLFATLQTVASLWRIERQNRNAQEIARQGAALYDKFADFVGDLDTIGTRLTQLQKGYDAAVNKLSTGRGNLISRVENLKELGLKPSRALPKANEEDEPLPQVAEG